MSQARRVLLGLEVFLGNSDLLLAAAQLNVVQRNFGNERYLDVAKIFFGGLDAGIGGFNTATSSAEDVQFPHCIQTSLKGVSRSSAIARIPTRRSHTGPQTA